MSQLRDWFRRLLGFQPTVYNPLRDPILIKYADIEDRVEGLWRPREFFDV